MAKYVEDTAPEGLTVVLARTSSPHHVGSLLPRGRDRTEDDDLFDDAGADFLGDTPLDGGKQ